MLDLEIIKQQCRIEPDDSDEDGLLETYSNAARRYVENYTDRPLFETPEAALISEAEKPLVLDDDITTAMLLMIGHWYVNREAVLVGVSTATLPLAVEAILWPYRRLGV
ncbi:head-tail connector protein [Vreelandella nanhaiensis]|uniref:Phage gp6-like head-tail connector protein n=1 Tax=Vreelandella nanhaiensis TaxID=1258546 RepID=A0A433KXM9_9GAMM|nr:head-tail connector protein [Halomonas nanhaiensis]RUR34481.1 phage gp6-like head-tail connector protein [Halomonas nanhaiensis]